jgi:hypothetical protein
VTELGGASENFLGVFALFQVATLKLCELFWAHRTAWPALEAKAVHFENRRARACRFRHMPSDKRCLR